jgi:K+-sensing histidine kinase KdpD
VRAPLGGIIGSSEMLLYEEKLNSEDHKVFIDIIHNSSNKMHNVVNVIKDTADIIFGKHTLQLEMVDIPNLLLKVEKELNNQYWMSNGSSFRFIIEFNRETANIEGDKNLLINLFLWFFGNISSHYYKYKETNVYFIHIASKPEFIEMSISNVTGGKKSKINESHSESAWMAIILEILKKHSGHLEFMVDGNNKNFAVITLPR